jgi:hypothetical protein
MTITAAFKNSKTNEETFHLDVDGHRLVTHWHPTWGFQTIDLGDVDKQLGIKEIQAIHEKLAEFGKTLLDKPLELSQTSANESKPTEPKAG